MLVPLNYSYFWVQIHDFPPSLHFEAVARQLRNFVGQFEDYDAKQASDDPVAYLQVQVRINIQLPINRQKKILLSLGYSLYVRFLYE